MPDRNNQPSLKKAALIAGVAILTMVVAAPFAELFVYPKLVVAGNAAVTVKNITTHLGLFANMILAYGLTFMCDLLAAWALYVLLKPVNNNLSMLAAWFRLAYTIGGIASLLNLVTVFHLVDAAHYPSIFGPDDLPSQVMLLLTAFRSGFHFSICFFSIHLVILGFMIIRSAYIPSILGILLIVSGLGYLTTTLQPFLFPGVNVGFVSYTFYGELIFMLWLLVKGQAIKADEITIK